MLGQLTWCCLSAIRCVSAFAVSFDAPGAFSCYSPPRHGLRKPRQAATCASPRYCHRVLARMQAGVQTATGEYSRSPQTLIAGGTKTGARTPSTSHCFCCPYQCHPATHPRACHLSTLPPDHSERLVPGRVWLRLWPVRPASTPRRFPGWRRGIYAPDARWAHQPTAA